MRTQEKEICLDQFRSLSILAFSPTGYETGQRVKKGLEKAGVSGMQVTLQGKSKYLEESIQESLRDWTKEQFKTGSGILFIGSCGIAVRAIAPFVQSKQTDPAVLVMDEGGTFVISLLSGHLGGANVLTNTIARIIDAVPVITTATDVYHRFAADVFAKENHCSLHPLKAVKAVSAAILEGEPVGFYSDFPIQGKLPRGLVPCDREGIPLKGQEGEVRTQVKNAPRETEGFRPRQRPAVGLAVSIWKEIRPFDTTLWVVPPCVTAGLGCKKGISFQALEKALDTALEDTGIFPKALCRAASIDLKAAEPGILQLTQSLGLPYVTYSKEALGEVKGDFTASAFVSGVTGVDNVCERSAVLAAGHGELIQRKRTFQGITIALALEEWSVYFE